MRWFAAMVALDGDVRGADGYDGGAGTDTATTRYGTERAIPGHPVRFVPTVAIVVLAACTVVGVWVGTPVVAGMLALCSAVVVRRFRLVALAVLVALAGSVRGAQAWQSLAPDRLGPYEGWVRVIDDPQPFPSATRVIVEVEGERFESWARGTGRRRVDEWRAGHWVTVGGERRALAPDRVHRVAWQHVVGELVVEWVGDHRSGDAIARASNRVRAAIERGAAQLPPQDAALFRGLVVGDDRDQPREMIERFRASGLSHLTAVSGQNVSFLLAASGPLLRRLRPWARWTVTLGLIAWFVALTRFEPSIVRAGVMAGLAATAYVLGRERAPVRILGLAVTGLVLVDPLLVWSIGFWLSVGATFGVSTVGPWLARRLAPLDRWRLFALPVGVTLGAQLGVVIPSVLVFGRLPLVSVPANLLAVPVAGAVMLYGLPAGLIAGWCPPLAPVAMAPARIGVRWVDTVAVLAERIEPDPPWQGIGWVAAIAALGAALLLARRRRSPDPEPARQTEAPHGDLPPDR